MGFEVDFVPVGDKSRCGDAIAFRYGDLSASPPTQTVVIIDGGTKDSGSKLVEHVREFYHTDQVDLVISSHPDSDHVSGLTEVFENLSVQRLWIHRPWEHDGIKDLFKDGRITDNSLKERMKELEAAYDLDALALNKGAIVEEPYTELTHGFAELTILHPTLEYYNSLLPEFRKTPEGKGESTTAQKIFTSLAEAVRKLLETADIETLAEPGNNGTSAENNSGVVLLLQVNGNKLLFTGDAGVEALSRAVDRADSLGINLQDCCLVQVPHHGSKHNVGPTILDRILGAKGKSQLRYAFASVSEDGEPKHPAKKVTNAFKRRGTEVYVTKGQTIYYHRDSPSRGWTTLVPLPFYDEVEE